MMRLLLAFSLLAPAMAFAQDTAAPAANPGSIVVKLGDAKSKKSLVALPPLQYIGNTAASPKYQSVGTEIFNVILNDLTVSSYFQFIPQSAFLEDAAKTGIKPQPEDPKGFKWENWSKIGAEFLIRGSFSITGDDLTMEVYMYQVGKSRTLFGKKYRAALSSARRLAHTFSNDVLLNLTGKSGPFLSKLVVASDREGGKWREIFYMDWDAARVEKLSALKTVAMSPAISPDGTKVAYTAAVQKRRGGMRNHDMFLLDLNTGKAKLISFRQGMNSGASFTPDGRFIFLTVSKGVAPDIYKMNLDGELVLQMTKGPNGAMNVEPSVSPDGTKIAFSSDRSGKTMIFTMDMNGGSVTRLTHAGQFNASPAWSPDGKKIAFAGFEENHFDIFVMNSDGTEMVRLTKANKPNGRPANNEDPTFSPDGRFVMYTSDRTGKNQIYISTVDGSEERRVTTDNANYYKPKWSKNID